MEVLYGQQLTLKAKDSGLILCQRKLARSGRLHLSVKHGSHNLHHSVNFLSQSRMITSRISRQDFSHSAIGSIRTRSNGRSSIPSSNCGCKPWTTQSDRVLEKLMIGALSQRVT